MRQVQCPHVKGEGRATQERLHRPRGERVPAQIQMNHHGKETPPSPLPSLSPSPSPSSPSSFPSSSSSSPSFPPFSLGVGAAGVTRGSHVAEVFDEAAGEFVVGEGEGHVRVPEDRRMGGIKHSAHDRMSTRIQQRTPPSPSPLSLSSQAEDAIV